MRKHGWLLAALALAGAGCHKGTAEKAPVEEPAAQADEDSSAKSAPAAAEEPEKPIAVTNAMIDRYIAYEDAALKTYQDTVQQVQKLDAKADAGAYNGTLGAVSGARDALNLLDRQQKAEEKARKESGLSEREIEKLRGIVGEVITRRQLLAGLHLDDQIKQFEKMRDQVPADQRKDMDDTIANLKQQQEENVNLTEVRKEYGDANVNAVLAREKDLTAAHDRWVKVFLGGK